MCLFSLTVLTSVSVSSSSWLLFYCKPSVLVSDLGSGGVGRSKPTPKPTPPQLTLLNSAVKEGYFWVGWQAGEGKSPVYQWMSLNFGGPGGIPLGGMGGGNEQLLFCTAVSSLATIASNSLGISWGRGCQTYRQQISALRLYSTRGWSLITHSNEYSTYTCMHMYMYINMHL